MKRSIFCLAPNRAATDLMLHELKHAGCSPADVSLVFLDTRATASALRPDARGTVLEVPPTSSTEIRGLVAWVPGAGTVVIDDAPPLVAAGAVGRAFNVATTGGLTGGLIQGGMPEAEAGRYRDGIMGGKTLIAMHHHNPEICAQTRASFARQGGEDIFTLSDTSERRAGLRPQRGASRFRTP